MNARELHNDKFDSKKAAKADLDASLKTSIVPNDGITDLRSLVRGYYYFKDLQSAVVLKLNAEPKVSFPAYLDVFSKVTTQTSLKLLEACLLAADMLAAPKEGLVETIRQTARFGENMPFPNTVPYVPPQGMPLSLGMHSPAMRSGSGCI